MIRVLQVLSGLHLGGVQSVVMNYYRFIDKSAVQFDFAVMDKEKGCLEDEAVKLGAHIYRLPDIKGERKKFEAELKNILRAHPEITIVHAHLNFLNYYVLRAAKQAGIKRRISHSHHAYKTKSVLVFMGRIALRELIGGVATDMWACSKKAGVWLYGKKNIGKRNFRLIYNAIDIEKYSNALSNRKRVRKELNLFNEKILVHIGRLSRDKNQTFLLTVLDLLKMKNINVKLLLIGGGQEEGCLREQTEDLGITDKVIFTGWIQNVCDYLAAGDVFVFPSLFEGLGVVVLEAQASGLPCIVSKAVPEEAIFDKGNHSVEYAELDAETWADRICQISDTLSDRETRVRGYSDNKYNIRVAAVTLKQYYLEQ